MRVFGRHPQSKAGCFRLLGWESCGHLHRDCWAERRGALSERFILVTGRTKEQGQARYAGKVSPSDGRGRDARALRPHPALETQYERATACIEMNAEDMARIGVVEGQVVYAETSAGQAELTVHAAVLPAGVVFVPLGPAASRLSGTETEGTGMPLLKGCVVVIASRPRQTEPEPTSAQAEQATREPS